MRTNLLVALAGLLSACALLGGSRLPSDEQRVLREADAMTLYSLEPAQNPGESDTTLHHWKVTGQAQLDAEQRQRAAAALLAAVAAGDASSAMKCFWPRVALRATRQGRTMDFLICFHCRSVEVLENDEDLPGASIGGTSQAFDQLQTELGLPISHSGD